MSHFLLARKRIIRKSREYPKKIMLFWRRRVVDCRLSYMSKGRCSGGVCARASMLTLDAFLCLLLLLVLDEGIALDVSGSSVEVQVEVLDLSVGCEDFE